jgi:pantetheine-phosphate adenylyltransferase
MPENLPQSTPANILAVFPGTFDPITLGHEDMLRRAAKLFDRLIIAVAAGHHKKTMFTLDERMDMARHAVRDFPHVQVASFSGLMRDFVVANGVQVMVRGLRAVTDFDYEYQLAGMNRALMPDVETLFLTPISQYQFVSSTYVRDIATLGDTQGGTPGGAAAQFVSPYVFEKLQVRVAQNKG